MLVKENCSRCHAVGKEGDIPHEEATPFRSLPADRRPCRVARRRDRLRASGHAGLMFSPHDAQAIIEYLQSIQANRPALSRPRNA